MSIQKVTADVGPSPLVIETGKMAKLADGVSPSRWEKPSSWSPLFRRRRSVKDKPVPPSVEYKERASAGVFPMDISVKVARPKKKSDLSDDGPPAASASRKAIFTTPRSSLSAERRSEKRRRCSSMNGAGRSPFPISPSLARLVLFAWSYRRRGDQPTFEQVRIPTSISSTWATRSSS